MAKMANGIGNVRGWIQEKMTDKNRNAILRLNETPALARMVFKSSSVGLVALGWVAGMEGGKWQKSFFFFFFGHG